MPPPENILAVLRKADWKRIYPSLVAYARNLLLALPSVRAGGLLPQSMHPEDVAQKAIQLVFEGERQWDPVEEPDLGRYLATSVARSLISNAVQSVGHTRRNAGASLDMDVYAESSHDPLVLAASGECENVLRTIVQQATIGDDHLADIQMGLEDGMRSAEIAEFFSIEVSEVYTLTRKLRRRILTAMADHECWEDHPLIATIATSR